ncbi:hypothetical protein [Geosporobacter ferrireducens]|uniref:Uncharacterized protein n=1 Tax=Geosporobacter ferrireducens TaxID=1424294 RepID=A0A1D8GFF1_9FIRM|nr:hypothetical protein [Geosporobacter ferrireducens]AOT69636.1 hypothetical protein Gferi_08625 [Geosporobacter ferrireducens]MTI54661.1 hypothetical protein [Geosporobacter ferrireducens]
MRRKKIISVLVGIAIICSNGIAILNMQISENTAINKPEAEELLKETYKPLEDFIKELVFLEDENALPIPEHIKEKEDFIGLFNNMNKISAESIYESLILEKNGELYVDHLAYIPSIYSEDAKISKAFIRKRKKLVSILMRTGEIESEKLIIKEKWMISQGVHGRSNYFIKNESGDWILEYANGTRSYGFVEPSQNPWSKYWLSKEGKE